LQTKKDCFLHKKAEDMELKFNYQEGLTISQIAEKHKRKRGAISSRLKKTWFRIKKILEISDRNDEIL